MLAAMPTQLCFGYFVQDGAALAQADRDSYGTTPSFGLDGGGAC